MFVCINKTIDKKVGFSITKAHVIFSPYFAGMFFMYIRNFHFPLKGTSISSTVAYSKQTQFTLQFTTNFLDISEIAAVFFLPQYRNHRILEQLKQIRNILSALLPEIYPYSFPLMLTNLLHLIFLICGPLTKIINPIKVLTYSGISKSYMLSVFYTQFTILLFLLGLEVVLYYAHISPWCIFCAL